MDPNADSSRQQDEFIVYCRSMSVDKLRGIKSPSFGRRSCRHVTSSSKMHRNSDNKLSRHEGTLLVFLELDLIRGKGKQVGD